MFDGSVLAHVWLHMIPLPLCWWPPSHLLHVYGSFPNLQSRLENLHITSVFSSIYGVRVGVTLLQWILVLIIKADWKMTVVNVNEGCGLPEPPSTETNLLRSTQKAVKSVSYAVRKPSHRTSAKASNILITSQKAWGCNNTQFYKYKYFGISTPFWGANF